MLSRLARSQGLTGTHRGSQRLTELTELHTGSQRLTGTECRAGLQSHGLTGTHRYSQQLTDAHRYTRAGGLTGADREGTPAQGGHIGAMKPVA